MLAAIEAEKMREAASSLHNALIGGDPETIHKAGGELLALLGTIPAETKWLYNDVMHFASLRAGIICAATSVERAQDHIRLAVATSVGEKEPEFNSDEMREAVKTYISPILGDLFSYAVDCGMNVYEVINEGHTEAFNQHA